MAIKAQDYIAKLPNEEQIAIKAEAQRLIAEESTLSAIREARQKSQTELAEKLGVGQPAISKIERQTDMFLSTFRGYIVAMGGELEIVARFPDRAPVRITQFKPLRRRLAKKD
jgi:Helix-turn-helix domain